jgi:hypothetical protein
MFRNMTTFGEVTFVRPSLSTCFDLVSMWSDEQSRSVTGRLCAMAICVCGDNAQLPKQRHIVDVHQYGSKCLDTLLGAGVSIPEILDLGMQCITLMANALPSQSEVAETENFTEPPNLDK